jgi:hypothetical protein
MNNENDIYFTSPRPIEDAMWNDCEAKAVLINAASLAIRKGQISKQKVISEIEKEFGWRVDEKDLE